MPNIIINIPIDFTDITMWIIHSIYWTCAKLSSETRRTKSRIEFIYLFIYMHKPRCSCTASRFWTWQIICNRNWFWIIFFWKPTVVLPKSNLKRHILQLLFFEKKYSIFGNKQLENKTSLYYYGKKNKPNSWREEE